MARQKPAPSKQHSQAKLRAAPAPSHARDENIPVLQTNPFLPLPAAPGREQQERGQCCNRSLGHKYGVAKLGVGPCEEQGGGSALHRHSRGWEMALNCGAGIRTLCSAQPALGTAALPLSFKVFTW